MKSEDQMSPIHHAKRSTVTDGLVICLPKSSEISMQNLLSKKPVVSCKSNHKRVGSTGTTADEYTTDEEDNNETDELDLSIKDPMNRDLFFSQNTAPNSCHIYSDIATITDKVRHVNVMHRNSSDSSVYSDLSLQETEGDSDGKSGPAPGGAVSEQAFLRLQNELKDANLELKQRDEELTRLSRIRQDVESELEDLTASLFQEAHNMVRDANERQASAEKSLKESQMKVDVLTAEVAALKTMVLTSTPSHPNPHLHPQISKDEGVAIFTKKHRRSPSHFNLKYGRENSPPGSPVKESKAALAPQSSLTDLKEDLDVDPVLHREFMEWRAKPSLARDNLFMERVYKEDIDLCLAFSNEELSQKVLNAVESGMILVEAVGDKTKATFPKKCALLEIPRMCYYRMNIGETDTWYSISQICRNRIISVCDFLNYLKYIDRGLVKSSAHDVFWEVIRLRKNMVLARLGLSLVN